MIARLAEGFQRFFRVIRGDQRCAELGATLITADYPEEALKALREAGYHE